jgi:hypothetical protein
MIEMTADEVLSTLNHSALPTVVVEGGDDIIVFRKLEETLAHLGVSVFAARGRNTLLDVFKRRAEITNGQGLLLLLTVICGYLWICRRNACLRL